MSQRAKLIPGQWYRIDGHHGCEQIVFLIGFRRDGLAVCEVDECTTSFVYVDKNEWEHLPECDSFDWKPKREYVRLFINKDGFVFKSYYQNTEETDMEVKHDGTGFYVEDAT
jgi:hypothetical protein